MNSFTFFDIDYKLYYYIKIFTTPYLSGSKKIIFFYQGKPESNNSLNEFNTNLDHAYLISRVKWWIGLIVKYNEIAYEEQERFKKIYEDEF